MKPSVIASLPDTVRNGQAKQSQSFEIASVVSTRLPRNDGLLIVSFVFLLAFFLSSCTACGPCTARLVTSERAAGRILKTYEANWFQLSPAKQGHFAVRLYRVTGNSKYLDPISSYAEMLKTRFIRHVSNLDEPAYAEQMGESWLRAIDSSSSAKRKVRAEILKAHAPFLFQTQLIYLAYQIKNFGLEQNELAALYRKAAEYLSRVEFRKFLLDDQVIRCYAPQAVNYVYYLKDLGLRDLEAEYERKFKFIFMEQDDSRLNEVDYDNKIYGLTHFVIAGSDYYQNYVSAEKYQWILDYFEAHIDEVLTRGKADMIAEVGLVFKLCGLKDHPVVSKTQNYLLNVFDSKLGLIPSADGKGGLNRSEHRNIIAYLLFSDFDRLYPGLKLEEH